MSVFQACAAGWNEGFQKFSILCNLLEKAKSRASNIFIWMLLRLNVSTQETGTPRLTYEVVSNGITSAEG